MAMTPKAGQTARLMDDGDGLRIAVRPDKSGLLLGVLHDSEVRCELKEGGVPGMDIIDFGQPSEADHARIKRLFVEWCEVNT